MTPTALRPPAAIAILGAGNMGSGIAQACAQAGFEVRVRDVDDAAIQLGRGRVEKMLAGAIERKKLTPARRDEVLTRLRFTTGVGEAVRGAALVIEAVFEDVAVKRAAFADIAAHVGADVIVATNTSSLQVTELAKGFPHLERFAGLHFFYPAAINKLVEVIGGEATAPATRRELERFCYLLKKIPIDTADRAGFCVNRYFVPYLNEATRLAEEGVANLATIEEVGRELFGATLGPFELMNVTGIPIAFHAETSLYQAYGPAYAPSKLLEEQFPVRNPVGLEGDSRRPGEEGGRTRPLPGAHDRDRDASGRGGGGHTGGDRPRRHRRTPSRPGAVRRPELHRARGGTAPG